MSMPYDPARLAGHAGQPVPSDDAPTSPTPSPTSTAERIAANAVRTWEALERAGQHTYELAHHDLMGHAFLPTPRFVETSRTPGYDVDLIWPAGETVMVASVRADGFAIVRFNFDGKNEGRIDVGDDDATVRVNAMGIGGAIQPFLVWGDHSRPPMPEDEAAFYREALRVASDPTAVFPAVKDGGCCGGTCKADAGSPKETSAMSDDVTPMAAMNNAPAAILSVAQGIEDAQYGASPVSRPTMAALDATRDKRVAQTTPFARQEVKAAVNPVMWMLIKAILPVLIAAILKAFDKSVAGAMLEPE